MCACTHACVCVYGCMHGGQRTTHRSYFSSSAQWVPGIKLTVRFSGRPLYQLSPLFSSLLYFLRQSLLTKE